VHRPSSADSSALRHGPNQTRKTLYQRSRDVALECQPCISDVKDYRASCDLTTVFKVSILVWKPHRLFGNLNTKSKNQILDLKPEYQFLNLAQIKMMYTNGLNTNVQQPKKNPLCSLARQALYPQLALIDDQSIQPKKQHDLLGITQIVVCGYTRSKVSTCQ
jgi:hypothetical protein